MNNPPDLEAAAQSAARAEFGLWTSLLAERDLQVAAIETQRSAMFQRMTHNAVITDIAQRLSISERQVWNTIDDAETLRDRSGQCWAAFESGLLNGHKASLIAGAVERTTSDAAARAVDEAALGYAPTHTPAELRRWLTQLVDRLEALEIEEAERVRAQRNVTIEHESNGMSWLKAYVPSLAAVAIQSRLTKAAKQLTDDADQSQRTQTQKQADLLTAWLTNATGTESDIKAEIAVVVEADALAGVSDTPVRIDGDSAIAPVSWIFDIAQSESTLWTRLLTDPRGYVLDVTHLGYQPPESLRKAVRWRDARCRVKGCGRKAEYTDLDHAEAFASGGPTGGHNIWCLCRKHHGMKGHGRLPDSAFAPPEMHLVRLPRPPVVIDYIAA